MYKRGVAVKLSMRRVDGKVEDKTHQSFARDADINFIMGRYFKTGMLVDPKYGPSTRVPRFGDFSDLPDYATVVDRMRQAQDLFMTLPAAVRAEFDNDAMKALDFVADPANVKRAVELKMLPESALPKAEEPAKPFEPVEKVVEKGAAPAATPTPPTAAS